MHIVRTIRLTIEENRAINDATAALESQRSTLIHEGVTEAAHRLGLFAGRDLPMRVPRWVDAPERGDDSARARFAVSFSPTTYELLRGASKLLDVSESIFVVGATLRYIAHLRTNNPKLQAVRLPAKYTA